MNPWIQVYANLPTHRKICRLRDALGLKSNYEAVGLIVCLWSWAAVNSPVGDLTGYSPRDISDAVGFRKTPGKLMDALTASGFLDRAEDGTVTIHDWGEHAALLMASNEQQKKNTRDRVRRYRERRRAKEPEGVSPDSNVTCNGCNAPTLPNLTSNSGGDGVYTPAREADPVELASIGLSPGEFVGVTAPVTAQIQAVGANLFRLYAPFTPCTVPDCRKIFEYIARTDFQTGVTALDVPAAGLLEYAFEMARQAGKPGNWNYIDGIMARCNARGIMTAQAAREWDDARPDIYGEEAIG